MINLNHLKPKPKDERTSTLSPGTIRLQAKAVNQGETVKSIDQMLLYLKSSFHSTCTLTTVRDAAQVSSHEMISIYIAHAIGYKVDPLFTGCCSSCGDDGTPFEHLAPCLWPRRLLRQGNISGC